MRLALASLIALGVVSTAVAQEQPAPAAAPAPAPAAAPVDQAAPADQAAPVVPAPAAGTPEAAAAAAAPEAVRPPPPTDPVSVKILSVLDTICKPAVVGGDFNALAKAAGFKKKKDLWTLDLGKPYQIVLDNPGSNKNVCTLNVQHAQGPDQAQHLATALHDWATWENSPQLKLIRNDQLVTDVKRLTVTWDNNAAGGKAGLVYVRIKKLDDSSIGKNFEQAQILYTTQ